MSNSIGVLEAIAKIEEAAHRNAKTGQKVREINKFEIGSTIRQGDIYLTCVRKPTEAAEKKLRKIGTGHVKVALGTNEGSRHYAEGPDVTAYSHENASNGISLVARAKKVRKANVEMRNVQTGPLLCASNTWMLTHPQHDMFKLPAGWYQVTYQLDARTMRAVED